jgi:hypothetical protein
VREETTRRSFFGCLLLRSSLRPCLRSQRATPSSPARSRRLSATVPLILSYESLFYPPRISNVKRRTHFLQIFPNFRMIFFCTENC